jgi:hypothetical protein
MMKTRMKNAQKQQGHFINILPKLRNSSFYFNLNQQQSADMRSLTKLAAISEIKMACSDSLKIVR